MLPQSNQSTPRRTSRPIYHANVVRHHPRAPHREPKLGLLDGAAGHAGKIGRLTAGCAGLFLSLVLLGFLSVLSLFGAVVYTILSNF